MSAKRIPTLKFDDIAWEGTGPTPQEAVIQAHNAHLDSSPRASGFDWEYDVFLRVEVTADGTVTFRAILR